MLIIHTALHGEARTFIRHFALKRRHSISVFACFQRDNIFLVESGIGKINTASAIGWACGVLNISNPVILNIGMAGHAHYSIGECYLASRIEDHATGHRYYPPQLADTSPDSHCLLTLDRPAEDYPEKCMIDMEASAFIRTATRFTTLELCQSIKVISDNAAQPARLMKDREVESLLTPHAETVMRLADELRQYRAELVDDSRMVLPRITQQWHFTKYQQKQLADLLQRHHTLQPDVELADIIPAGVDSSKAFIRWLDNHLKNLPVRFRDVFHTLY